MYELENLSWSWMFLLIVLIGGLYIIDRAWKIKTQRRYFSSSILERLSPNISMTKPLLKVAVIILSVFMFTIALINPKMGTKIKTFKVLKSSFSSEKERSSQYIIKLYSLFKSFNIDNNLSLIHI